MEPIKGAILDLEAEAKALRLVVGLLLADSARSQERLSTLLADLPGLARLLPITDDQAGHLKEVLERILEEAQALPYREQAGR